MQTARSGTARGGRFQAILALVLTLATNAGGAATDISDTPMAVKNNVAPNFMFMVDNSGSMRHIVPESPYDQGTTYLSSCPSANALSGGDSTPEAAAASSKAYYIVVRSTGVAYINQGVKFYTYGNSGTKVCFSPDLYYRAGIHGDSAGSGSGDCGASGSCKIPAGTSTAIYKGNYLNWYFGQAPGYTTAASMDYANGRKSGTHSRLDIAKAAANATLDSLPLPSGSSTKAKVRVGISTYHDGNGGTLKKGMVDLDSASTLSTLKGIVNALTSGGETPLSETLADIGHYFTIPYTDNLTLHPDAATPTKASVADVFKQGGVAPHKLAGAPATCSGTQCPIQYWCQRSYAVLLTDGQPRDDQGLSTNTHLCDYDGDSGGCTTAGANAYDRKTGSAATNHSGHSASSGAHTYDSNGSGSDYLDDVAQALYEIDLRPDLAPPADRSKKNNIRTYTIGFADDQVKNDPLMQEAATQGGGVFSTADNTAALTTAFKKAVEDAMDKDGASAAVAVVNTQITVDNTAYASRYESGYWTGDLEAFALNTTTGLPIKPSVWSAQAKLDGRTANDRNIVTYDGTAGAIFSAAATGLEESLVNYLRGERSLEGSTYRRRAHLLGDIVNAEPVVVKYGDKPVVFQGANDGMLHVFNGSIGGADSQRGTEMWAYVPRLLLSNLDSFASSDYSHKFYVDATPAVADVTLGGGAGKILVGGLGKGGRGYYALNITSATANSEADYAAKVLWEALGADARMGYSFGTPLIVNTPSDGHVVLVASGYNNGDTTGGDGHGRLFALDPGTGQILKVVDTGAGDASTPSGLAHLAKPSSGAADVVRYVYGGDLLGNVWRFDLSNWSVTRIASVVDANGVAQPISTAPVVGPVAGASGKQFVYVGTGLYLGDTDVPGDASENKHALQTQSIYGIVDDTAVVSPALPDIRGNNGGSCPEDGGDGDFLCQSPGASQESGTQYTNTAKPMANSRTGWYVDLPIANARVVTHPQLTSGGALVVTINVPSNAICDPGGSSWLVNVDAATGGAIAKTYGGKEYWGSFIFLDHALASRPVIVDTADGKRAVVRLSNQTFKSPEIHEPPVGGGGGPTGWRRVYWRELM